jgi:hypothetical protein
MVAFAHWYAQLWLVDSECPLSPIQDATPTEDLHVPPLYDDLDSSAKKRLANNEMK